MPKALDAGPYPGYTDGLRKSASQPHRLERADEQLKDLDP